MIPKGICYMNILIVDDDSNFRSSIKMLINEVSDHLSIVDESSSVKDSFKNLQEKKYDFVLCDYGLTDGFGIDVLNYMKKNDINSIFVLITSRNEKEIVVDAVNNNVFKYFDKESVTAESLMELFEIGLKEKGKNTEKSTMITAGEMMSSIMHEINNILSVVHGNATIIERYLELKEYDKIPKLLNTIIEYSEKASMVSSDVKSLISAHKVDREFVSLKTLFCGINEYLSFNHPDQKSIIDLSEMNRDESVFVNQRLFQEVFENLIRNSLDAISDSPEKWIKVKTFFSDGYIKIKFIDSGNGIPEDTIDKIFTKEYTKKKKVKGSGFGLFLVKKIVTEFDGIIFVEKSENTTFVISMRYKE